MPQHVTFSDGLPTGAKVEASGRPNWHAFGMLVACSGAGIVILLCYILVSFANAAVRKCGGSRQRETEHLYRAYHLAAGTPLKLHRFTGPYPLCPSESCVQESSFIAKQ
eukprot:scaffold114720_cov17-Tisochrysis_lutea.AAC.1